MIQSVLLSCLALTGPDPAAPEILSDSDCPSAQAVQAELLLLMPDARGGLVKIQRSSEGVELLLYSDQQSGPLRRQLTEQPACDQMARLAAAVIAIWRATVPPTPEPVRPPRPAPAPGPSPGEPPAPRLQFDVSASVAGVLGGSELSLGELLDVRLSLAARPFGVRIGVLLGTPHTLALNPEQAEWTRWSLRFLPGARLARGRFQIELGAGASLALIGLRGQGYERNRRSYGVDVGLGGGMRVGPRLGRIWPFLGVEAMGWLLPQLVRASHGAIVQEAEVPRLELLFSIGVLVADPRADRQADLRSGGPL